MDNKIKKIKGQNKTEEQNNLNCDITYDTEPTPGNLKVYSVALLFSIIVGFSFLGVKASMNYATTLEILTHRFNFAAIGVLVPLAFKFIKLELKGKPLKKLLMPAGFYVAFMAVQALGLIFASSIESGIFFAIIPIFAKIIAYFILGEKGNWKQNAFVTLSISAVIAMFVFSVQDFQGVSVTGLILLAIASILMGLSNVLTRGVRKEFGPYSISLAIALGGCLVFNLATVVYGIFSGEIVHYFEPLAHWQFALATAFLGIPSTVVSSLLMAYMLANMEAVKATIFGNLSTGISIVAGAVFLKEPLYAYHIICTIFIITGVVGTSLSGNGKPKISEKTQEVKVN